MSTGVKTFDFVRYYIFGFGGHKRAARAAVLFVIRTQRVGGVPRWQVCGKRCARLINVMVSYYTIAMASNLVAMASNLVAMASNLTAMASNLLAMASNLVAMASNLVTTPER